MGPWQSEKWITCKSPNFRRMCWGVPPNRSNTRSTRFGLFGPKSMWVGPAGSCWLGLSRGGFPARMTTLLGGSNHRAPVYPPSPIGSYNHTDLVNDSYLPDTTVVSEVCPRTPLAGCLGSTQITSPQELLQRRLHLASLR